MPATPFDSAHLGPLFGAPDVARLFTDGAEIRAMLIAQAALARVQGAAGVIPQASAAFLDRALMEVQIDPGGLGQATGENGVVVPALVAATRKALEAPEHAQYLHWGATSQDIIDTGLMLRMRRVLDAVEADLDRLLGALAELARAHADTPMLARTYGQAATTTSFGAVVAGWGWPLADLRAALPELRAATLWVSLSGAAGTASMLGPDVPGLRAALAAALGLVDPGRGWHTDRGPVTRLADWLTTAATACGKLAEDVLLLTREGCAEIRLGAGGASSTMPQKRNPVRASAILALSHQSNVARAGLGAGAMHRDQRDGAAWFTEWLNLPQLTLSAGGAMAQTAGLLDTLTPDPAAMAANLAATGGTIHAEALSFALCREMRRDAAQAAVKELCAALAGRDLADVARERWPDLPPDLFDPARAMGEAPADARRFAQAIRPR